MTFESNNTTEPHQSFRVVKQHQDEPLSDCVRNALDSYFEQLDGHSINNLRQMVLQEVERPLFQSTLVHTGGNQSKAAQVLGISRSTLRKKLARYGID